MSRRWYGLLFAFGLAACESPSVPLPPPDLTAFSFAISSTTEVQCTGKPNPRHADALMYFYNGTRGSGNITLAAHDGSFVTDPFPGQMGDQLDMYYETKTGGRSDDVCGQIQFGSVLISEQCF